MTDLTLTVTKSPHEVARAVETFDTDRLNSALALLGLRPVELSRMPGRIAAFVGDAPDSAVIEWERAEMLTPFERSRTELRITAHDPRGLTIAGMLTDVISSAPQHS